MNSALRRSSTASKSRMSSMFIPSSVRNGHRFRKPRFHRPCSGSRQTSESWQTSALARTRNSWRVPLHPVRSVHIMNFSFMSFSCPDLDAVKRWTSGRRRPRHVVPGGCLNE
jgi:hypothetical protein